MRVNGKRNSGEVVEVVDHLVEERLAEEVQDGGVSAAPKSLLQECNSTNFYSDKFGER